MTTVLSLCYSSNIACSVRHSVLAMALGGGQGRGSFSTASLQLQGVKIGKGSTVSDIVSTQVRGRHIAVNLEIDDLLPNLYTKTLCTFLL